jgi:hypothetical protein
MESSPVMVRLACGAAEINEVELGHFRGLPVPKAQPLRNKLLNFE